MPTSYVRDMMEDMAADGLDDELRQLAADDVELLGQLEVSSERERNLAFYLDHFLDELCAELGMPVPADRRAIVAAAFSNLRGGKDVGLADIRSALYRAMGGRRTKTAYPNTAGVMETNIKPQRDVSKWVRTLGEIHAAKYSGETKEGAMRRLTEEWDPVEKLDFQQWLRYYERGDHEKYAELAATVQEPTQPVQSPTAPAQQQPPLVGARRGRPKAETRSVTENQKALVGRLDSARRLLHYLQPAWPAARWNSIYEALSHLEQEIVSLRTASSMRDRIVRTAGILVKAGFQDGAEILFKIAQPPGEDVASQIEKALTGREYETKPGGEPPTGGLPTDLPPPLPPPPEGGTPPPEGEAAAPAPPAEGMPPEAMETLPEPPPPPPAPEGEGKSKPAKDENPYAGSTAKDALEILEPLMRKFKERETVRQLSKVDMMMDALNIVSYFPELGEAIGRLIETDSYVGTRLEKVIGKLRGGLREEDSKEKPQPPSVEMGPPPEETAVSVGEKLPAAPPPPVEEKAVEVGEQPAAPVAPTAPAAPAAPAAPGV